MSLIDGQRSLCELRHHAARRPCGLTRHKLNLILSDRPQLGPKLLLVLALLQLMTNRLHDATTRMLSTILGEAT